MNWFAAFAVDLIGENIEARILGASIALSLTVFATKMAIQYQRVFIGDQRDDINDMRLELDQVRADRDHCEKALRIANLEIVQLEIKVLRLGGTIEQGEQLQ